MNAEIALFLIQDGFTNGAIYALLALALVLVFAVTRVIFIPQGEFVAYGALTLASRRDGDAVEISVSDSGPGIPDEVAGRLFEPFFTTKPQGTGLGLGIARQITEEHGGELRWESVPGGGATFTIRLPVKRAASA